MRKFMFVALLVLIASFAFAGQKAITDTGEEVILNNDGTWKYVNSSATTGNEIHTNNGEFIKPSSASFLLKSTKNNSAFWVDTEKWSFKKGKSNEDAEYELQLKGHDLYGLIITEAIHVPVESLVDIALENAKDASPEIELIKKEYRVVNGKKVIYMEMGGAMQGMQVAYRGYYYSDDSGSTQYLIYTGANLVDKYTSEINDFLNGLVMQ